MDTKTACNLSISDAVIQASNCINSLYPLTNFIACNSLKAFENIKFEDAMHKAGQLFGARGFLPLAEYRAMYETGRIAPGDLEEAFSKNRREAKEAPMEELTQPTVAEMFDKISGSQIVSTINKQMVKWCSTYLDRTQAQWKPDLNQGLFAFWRDLAPHDLSMQLHGVKDWSRSIEQLPQSSEQALEKLLAEFEIESALISPYLRQHITQLPGFASHLKWQQVENGEHSILTDYLAIRLHYEKMLAQVAALQLYHCSDLGRIRSLIESKYQSLNETPAKLDDYGALWQDAYEINYRNKLLSGLRTQSQDDEATALCQMVFCIDVRSEPLRRRLEQLGNCSTYGFAGFFGMPMRLTEAGSAMSLDLCPVLLKPDKEVVETNLGLGAQTMSWQALKISILQLKKKLKCNLAGAFGLVELLGLCSSIPLLTRTFLPAKSQLAWKRMEQNIVKKGATRLDLSNFSLDQKIALAQGAINGIGFKSFAKVVVFCGHKSTSVNNPFASSLDCGACGANGGGYSARLAADVLNDQNVRSGLLQKGIAIPHDTVFIAAEHDTTTDYVCFLDTPALSEDQQSILAKLREDVMLAGQDLRQAKAETLPKSCLDNLNHPLERACDWAQIAPEWGLAGNAAFIAAPRSLTKDTDLAGRVFLHSYDYSLDSSGKVLELIMTAPLVVAQWINMQYYLSTMDNAKFGSGSKAVHNVVGDFGVMQGAASDLRIGLPLQSLCNADKLQHEPMRLLALIRAPLTSIDAVLQAHPEVRQLVANRWIRLVALNPTDLLFYEARDCQQWDQIDPQGQAMTKHLTIGDAAKFAMS